MLVKSKFIAGKSGYIRIWITQLIILENR